jgi:hypothetical protein
MLDILDIVKYLDHQGFSNITSIDIIKDNTNITSCDSLYWMYRAEHDTVANSVRNKGGFEYPPNDHSSIVGYRGIFFTCKNNTPNHILHYAKDKVQSHGKNFFMCPMPLPVDIAANYVEFPNTFIKRDMICRNIGTKNIIGDEFIKSGLYGDCFEPDILISVRIGH